MSSNSQGSQEQPLQSGQPESPARPDHPAQVPDGPANPSADRARSANVDAAAAQASTGSPLAAQSPVASPSSSPSEVPASPPGRVAAVDYGTVRIGIAICDPRRSLASPYETYARRNPALDAKYFQNLAREERVVLFVVGLPVHLNGRESQKSQEARRFAQWLHETTQVPVRLFDERFTTVQAEAILEAADLTSKKRKERRDRLAAQILLTAFLESPNASEEPGSLG